MRFLSVLCLLLLLGGAGGPHQAMQAMPTGPPRLLSEDYGYLNYGPLTLRLEREYREFLKQYEGDAEFVPLGAAPTGLSEKALFDSTLVLGREVPLAVDGDSKNGYALIVDLNANGNLADDRRWPMKKRTGVLWGETKQAHVVEIDTSVPQSYGGEPVSAPVRLWVALSEDMVRIPGEAGPRRQAGLADGTLREGRVKSRGRTIRFAVSGVGGIYGDDYNTVLFDLDGDGKLDPNNRLSSEYFWVWERAVNLNGEGYEFSVDRYGRSLTLTPLHGKLPERPSLEVGHEAPDFAFTDLDGRRRRLKDYRGKIVLLDFWGTWCSACVTHAPTLAEAYGRFHEKGFEILGIHSGGTEEELRRFTAEHKMIWPQTLEAGEMPEGRPLQKLYRFLGAPHYFVVGKDGRILASDIHKPAEVVRLVEQQLD